jgi:hypothetical protein
LTFQTVCFQYSHCSLAATRIKSPECLQIGHYRDKKKQRFLGTTEFIIGETYKDAIEKITGKFTRLLGRPSEEGEVDPEK